MAISNGVNPTFPGDVTSQTGIVSEGTITATGESSQSGVNITNGGTVTQATSAITGVTLDTDTGQITTFLQNIAAAGNVVFTVTNSTVSATSVVLASLASGSVGGTSYAVVSAVGTGTFDITVSNINAATAETGTLVINFAVIGGSAT